MNSYRLRFIAETATRMVALLFAVSAISFFLVHISPMNPIDAFLGDVKISEEQQAIIAAKWGLDKTPVEQYFIWLKNSLSGDMGESRIYHQTVTTVIADKFATSLYLMIAAWALSGVLGFSLGVLAGYMRGTVDRVIKGFCLVLASTPVFWIGLLLLVIFAVELQLFPLGLAGPVGQPLANVTLGERLHHLVLPVITLSITGVANIALHTRQKVIDVMNTDYILFARARGEKSGDILRRHVLRNILLPAITLQFAYFSELFGGSVLAETVFSYPGLGSTAVLAGTHADAPLLLGIAVFSAAFVFTGNLIANILYGVIDPTIGSGARRGEEVSANV